VEAVWPWLRSFIPAPLSIGRREWLFACLGALIGICGTEWICRHALGSTSPWFIAPMGASAVLLLTVPASPLAQPWSIIGGNLCSALIGVTCARLIPEPALAAAVATVAGLLLAPITFVHANMGFIGLKAFPAAVVGGFTSLPGAIVGGLIIGVVEALAGFYLPEGFKDVAAYIVVLLMLALKPNGLFGENLRKKV